MSKIPDSILPLKKTAFVPVVENSDGEITDSKFGGTPYLLRDENYPLCRNCGEPLQLFLQLNSSQIPEQLKNEFGAGLIQLFYCTNDEPMCEIDCEAFFPFAKSVTARLINVENGENQPSAVKPENPFPPKRIVGWTETEDFPNREETKKLGIELKKSDAIAVSKAGFPRTGEKLSGWALWVQGIEYPNCRICGQEMRLVFQLDSEANLPFMFGDVGTGHLTQCPAHKEELAFGWACS